jgi:hypothetical protein
MMDWHWDFVIVDLRAQRNAVANFSRERTKDEILGWLCGYGQLKCVIHDHGEHFHFLSVSGCRAVFWFDLSGSMIVVR